MIINGLLGHYGDDLFSWQVNISCDTSKPIDAAHFGQCLYLFDADTANRYATANICTHTANTHTANICIHTANTQLTYVHTQLTHS